jgi:hypothetical protein
MAFKPQALGLVRARITQSLSAERLHFNMQAISSFSSMLSSCILQSSVDVLTHFLPRIRLHPSLLIFSGCLSFGPSSRSLFGATPAHGAISNSLCIFNFPIHVQLIYGI